MTIALPRRHRFFIGLYFITFLILLFDVFDTIPGTAVLRKIKYVYIVVMLAYFAVNRKLTKRQLLACIPLVFLTLHAIIFGFLFTNATVITDTHDHVRECLIFYLFVFVTFYYVSSNNCLVLFLQASFAAIIIQLGYAAITHLGDFVNPLYYIYIFDPSNRIRADFGFGVLGYLGNYTVFAVLLSLMLVHFSHMYKWNKWAIRFILLIDIPVLLMLCSGGNRSPVVVTMLTVFFYAYFCIKKRIRNQSIKTLITALFLAIIGALIYYCLHKATRDLNIEGNLNAFHQVGNFWTGMGYVENHGFQDTICIYGVTTTSLDISYVYYYFTTGFIGCVMIGLAAVSMLILLLTKKKSIGYPAVIAVYIAMLFYAYWQVNLFSYVYYSNLVYMVIYMTIISQSSKLQAKPETIKVIRTI